MHLTENLHLAFVEKCGGEFTVAVAGIMSAGTQAAAESFQIQESWRKGFVMPPRIGEQGI
jgi:hypothetical protein